VTQEVKGSWNRELFTLPNCLWKFSKTKHLAFWQRAQISEAPCRQVNFETEQFRGLEKPQTREF
jgi:hypothetical protein